VLGLLLVGDLIAVRMYHAHADWKILFRLIPSVVSGVLLGVVTLWYADDAAVRRIIGATLILLVVLRLVLMIRQRQARRNHGPSLRDWRTSSDRSAGSRRWLECRRPRDDALLRGVPPPGAGSRSC